MARASVRGRDSATPKAGPENHSFNGTIEVTADGTVAVLYYDFRGNTPAAGVPTDVWLTHSHDGDEPGPSNTSMDP